MSPLRGGAHAREGSKSRRVNPVDVNLAETVTQEEAKRAAQDNDRKVAEWRAQNDLYQ